MKPQSLSENINFEDIIKEFEDNLKFPIYFMNKSEELNAYIDESHLTNDLGGYLDANIKEWLTNRCVCFSIFRIYIYLTYLFLSYFKKYFLIV